MHEFTEFGHVYIPKCRFSKRASCQKLAVARPAECKAWIQAFAFLLVPRCARAVVSDLRLWDCYMVAFDGVLRAHRFSRSPCE